MPKNQSLQQHSKSSKKERIKTWFKVNYLLILISILILIRGFLWLGLIPALQTPDAERHFSTIQWYAEPTIKDWDITEDNDSIIDVLNSSTFHIPPEYMRFLEITQFEETRFNPNSHQTFSDGSKNGIDEEKISAEGLNPHFIEIPPTIVYYPPLYYKIGAWLYALIRNSDLLVRVYAIGLYSLLLSFAVQFFAYKCARRLDFSKTGAALFMGIVALQPMFSQTSISVNPDIMLILGMTMFTYFSISILKTKLCWQNVLGIVAASLVASYAKTPGLITWLFLVILALFKIKKRTFLVWSSSVSISLLFVFVIWPTFFLKKFNALTAGLFSSNNIFASYFDALGAYLAKHFAPLEQYRLFASYWGWFGWLDYPLNKSIYMVILVLVSLGLLSFFAYLIKKNSVLAEDKNVYIFFALFVVIFHIGIVYSEFSYFKGTNIIYGLQGRYFMPAIVAYFLILMKGFQFLLKRLQPELILKTLFVLVAILNIISLIAVILPAYYL